MCHAEAFFNLCGKAPPEFARRNFYLQIFLKHYIEHAILTKFKYTHNNIKKILSLTHSTPNSKGGDHEKDTEIHAD